MIFATSSGMEFKANNNNCVNESSDGCRNSKNLNLKKYFCVINMIKQLQTKTPIYNTIQKRKCESTRILFTISKIATLFVLFNLVTSGTGSPIKAIGNTANDIGHIFDPQYHDINDDRMEIIMGHKWREEDGKYYAVEEKKKISRPSRSISTSSCIRPMLKVSTLADHAYTLAVQSAHVQRIQHKRHISDNRLRSSTDWGAFYHAKHERLKLVICQIELVPDVMGRVKSEIKISIESMLMLLQELMNRSGRSFQTWSGTSSCNLAPIFAARHSRPLQPSDYSNFQRDIRRSIVRELHDIDRTLHQICKLH